MWSVTHVMTVLIGCGSFFAHAQNIGCDCPTANQMCFCTRQGSGMASQYLSCPETDQFPALFDVRNCEDEEFSLNVVTSAFTEIPANAFSSLQRFMVVFEGNTKLVTIRKGAFTANIGDLTIRGSPQLTTVEEGAFEGWSVAEADVPLSLTFDGIENFDVAFGAGAFSGLENLQTLTLANVNGLTLKNPGFKVLRNLRRLHLENVSLSDSDVWFSFPKLQVADLQNTQLTTIPKGLKRSKKLQHLDLTRSKGINCDNKLCWLFKWKRLIYKNCDLPSDIVQIKGLCSFVGKNGKIRRIRIADFIRKRILHQIVCPEVGLDEAENSTKNRVFSWQQCTSNSQKAS